MDFFRKIIAFFTAISNPQSSQHIALGGDTNAGTTTFFGFLFNVEPEIFLNALHFFTFRIGINLTQDVINFFQFKINNIIHQTLGFGHMVLKQGFIEAGLIGKRIGNVRQQIDRQ